MRFVTRLLLVRHCESAGQAPDAALTDAGRRQSQTLARFLADYPVDMIAASSYVRARQSIEPFAAAAGLPVRADDRLIEQTLAAPPVEDWRGALQNSFDDLDFRLPGGESGRDVLNRGWPALAELLEGGHRLPVAVTHGRFLSTILDSVDGCFGHDAWQALSNPDVFALEQREPAAAGEGAGIGRVDGLPAQTDAGAWKYRRIWRGGTR